MTVLPTARSPIRVQHLYDRWDPTEAVRLHGGEALGEPGIRKTKDGKRRMTPPLWLPSG